jgi:hypothetical protein
LCNLFRIHWGPTKSTCGSNCVRKRHDDRSQVGLKFGVSRHDGVASQHSGTEWLCMLPSAIFPSWQYLHGLQDLPHPCHGTRYSRPGWDCESRMLSRTREHRGCRPPGSYACIRDVMQALSACKRNVSPDRHAKIDHRSFSSKWSESRAESWTPDKVRR